MSKKKMDSLENRLEQLLTSSQKEINSRIEKIAFDIRVGKTNSKGYCYSLKTDANGNLRLIDLIDFLDTKIVDYAIPRKERDQAKKHLIKTNSTSKILELRKKASGLFTDLEKTGEGGEILLYVLVEEFLKFPQIICKMPLKTSKKLHYQGADGIHASYDSKENVLNLYWGEAKMYSDVNSAIKKCFESLHLYLLEPFGHNSIQERDLQLITDNIGSNLNNVDLEDILVRYFDKDDDLSNNLVYKGICFIGFDYDKYPPVNNTTESIKTAIEAEMYDWIIKVENYLTLKKLEFKEIHVFLMPFPSVSEFRKYYVERVK